MFLYVNNKQGNKKDISLRAVFQCCQLVRVFVNTGYDMTNFPIFSWSLEYLHTKWESPPRSCSIISVSSEGSLYLQNMSFSQCAKGK